MKDKKLLQVVEDAMKGDKESFSKLMQMRSRNILYIAISIIHDKELSQDVAQEVALRMQRDIVNLKNPETFDSWMYRAVYNACMNEKKKMKRSLGNIAIDPFLETADVLESREEFLPESYVSNEEKRKSLLAVINELPEKYQICVLLFYYEDMKYQEIAEVLETDVDDVSYRLRTAKRILRKKFGGDVPEEKESTLAKATAALVAAPVITQVLHLDEQGVVTSSMVERFVSVVATGSAASVAGTAAATTATATAIAPIAANALGGTLVTGITIFTSVMAAAAIAVGTYSYSIVGAPDVFSEDTSEVITEHSVDYVGTPHTEFTSSKGFNSPYGVSEIRFVDNESDLVSVTWTISSADSGEILLSGEGTAITPEGGLTNLGLGEYRVDFFATDTTDGTAHIYRNFTIEK